jgi:putative flippase GtrA
VTVLDVAASRLCELFLPLVAANTIGVVLGFTVQYFLVSNRVYNSRNTATFVKFLLTFFLGLLLANGIVWLFREQFFGGSDSLLAFAVSKGASIVLPFFAIYFIRKAWIGEAK